MTDIKEPQCLNEIPDSESLPYHKTIFPSDVQRLVCREIINISKEKCFDEDVICSIQKRVLLSELFNITDEMIEEERRRGR